MASTKREVFIIREIKDMFNSLIDLGWMFGEYSFERVCCKELSLVEFITLKKIVIKKEIAIKEVGKITNYTKSGITRIINRLEQKNYILKDRSNKDGRICCVVPTKKGMEVIEEISDEYEKIIEKKISSLNTEEIKEISYILKKLISKLNEE